MVQQSNEIIPIGELYYIVRYFMSLTAGHLPLSSVTNSVCPTTLWNEVRNDNMLKLVVYYSVFVCDCAKTEDRVCYIFVWHNMYNTLRTL